MASATLGSPGFDGQPAVYLYIATLEVNVLNCRISRVCVGQSGWRSVMVAAGGPARARASARRRAPGGRYRPAMHRTRSAELTAHAHRFVSRLAVAP